MSIKKTYQKKIELGLTFFKNANYLKGLRKFKEAEKIEKKHFLVYWYLGHTHFKLYNYVEAIRCIKKSIELKSKDILNLNFLAELYFANNQYDRAISTLKELQEQDKSNKEALIILAKIHTNKGNFEEAIKNYNLILINEPSNYGVHYELIKLNKKNLTEALINKINDDLRFDNISDENKMYANLILANNEKLNKDYKLQLKFLDQSHKIFFEKKKIASSQEWNYFSNLLPNFIEKSNQNTFNLKENDDINPIFIFGLPRSGTTLVENIIGSGSMKLPMGGEVEPFSKVFFSENIIKNYDSKDLETNFGFKKNDYQKLKESILFHYNHLGLINSKTKNIFTDKSLENFLYIDIIQKIFPNAKFVYCKRNVLANILGIYNNFLPNLIWTHSIERIFQYFDIYYKKLDVILNKKNLNFMIINIEEITNEPQKISKELYSFLELKWSSECIDLENNNNISKTASNIQMRGKISKHNLSYLENYIETFKVFSQKYNWFNI